MTVLLTALLSGCISLQAQNPRIVRSGEIPVFNYKIPVKPSEFVQQKEGFEHFADQVSNDTQSVLDSDEITDKSALKEIYDTLLSKALIDGDALKALDFVYERRALEENPSDKQLNGLIIQNIAESWMEKNSLDPAQIRNLFRFNLTEALNKLSWNSVRNEVEQLKTRFENMSPDVMIESVRSDIDPDYEKTGQVSDKAARMLLNYRCMMTRVEDFRKDIIEVLDDYIRQNRP